MLSLSTAQIAHLAQGPRDRFLADLAGHLNNVWALVHPQAPREFSAPHERRTLDAQLRYLLERGFRSAQDLACALELINLFAVEPRQPPLRAIMDADDQRAADKLAALASAAGLATPR